MSISRVKAATATAVLAGAALSGLILPGQAQAADAGLSVRVCVDGRELRAATFTGVYTNGNAQSWRVSVESNNCTFYSSTFTWKSGQTLKIQLHWIYNTNDTQETCYIKGADKTYATCKYRY